MTKAKAQQLCQDLFTNDIPFTTVEKGADDWNVIVNKEATATQVQNFATNRAVTCMVRIAVFS